MNETTRKDQVWLGDATGTLTVELRDGWMCLRCAQCRKEVRAFYFCTDCFDPHAKVSMGVEPEPEGS